MDNPVLPHLSTSGISHTCLYSSTAEDHHTLAGTHFPSHIGEEAELAWQVSAVAN